MLYVNASKLNTTDFLDMNITTTLTEYMNDEFIESEIVLTVLRNVSMNGTVLECQSEDLAGEIGIVNVNSAGNESYN